MSAFGMNAQQPSNNLWVGNNYSGFSPNRANFMDPRQVAGPYSQPPAPPQMNNILQVMGPESAMEYRVGPNSRVVLMDMNRPVFYVKSSDDSGYSETKAYEFHEVPMTSSPIDVVPSQTDEYATKKDLEDIMNSLDEFKKTIEDLVMTNG